MLWLGGKTEENKHKSVLKMLAYSAFVMSYCWIVSHMWKTALAYRTSLHCWHANFLVFALSWCEWGKSPTVLLYMLKHLKYIYFLWPCLSPLRAKKRRASSSSGIKVMTEEKPDFAALSRECASCQGSLGCAWDPTGGSSSECSLAFCSIPLHSSVP